MLSLNVFCSVCYLFLLYTTTSTVQGRYVYQPKIQRWIARDIIVATWEEAQHHCESQGATLATPTDTELLKYMLSIIEVNNHTTPYFIGIKARHRAQLQFVSEEGILLEDVSDGVQDMIERIDPRDGDCLCMDRNSIRVVPCWSRLPYMCYKSKNVTATDIPMTDILSSTTTATPTMDILSSTEPKREHESLKDKQDCGSGYKLYPTGSCYKVYKESRVSWEDANSTCTEGGGYLVVIDDDAELKVIREICSTEISSWVGLRDVTGNNNWRSVKGDDVKNIFNVWSSSRSGLECAVLTLNGDLDDRYSVGPYPFVCEKDLYEIDVRFDKGSKHFE